MNRELHTDRFTVEIIEGPLWEAAFVLRGPDWQMKFRAVEVTATVDPSTIAKELGAFFAEIASRQGS